MVDRPPSSTPSGPSHEVYNQARNPAFDAQLATRTAAWEASFFLPYLRPGVRLLDVGCGPGAITIGLAEVVAPGEVIGLDLRPEAVAQAQERAAERGVGNVSFQAGSAYALPFPDGAFDGVFAHVVLMHLREPARALAEMRRVLRPGGVAGVRDVDFGARVVFPLSPLREQYHALRDRVHQHNGGDPFLGRRHRRLLLDAGFTRVEAGGSVSGAGSLAETRRNAAFNTALLEGLAPTALEQGWVDQATLDAVQADFAAWAELPDAFYAAIYCHAIAWVDA